MSVMQRVPTDVAAAFDALPEAPRRALMDVREMIFEVAANDDRIGPLEEALRWGEPAYLTAKKKTGSTLRLGVEKASGRPAIFFNCNTTLVEEFRQKFDKTLSYSKNRAVHVDGAGQEALRDCITAALTYHLRG